MKVLVVTTPGWGHVSPVIPLARQLAARGHRVVWATAADQSVTLRQLGFDVREVGMPLEVRLPAARAILAERGAGTPPQEMRALAFTVHFAVLAAPSVIDGLSDVMTSLRPDVVVREPAELASSVLSHTAGAHVVTVGFGAMVPSAARNLSRAELADRLGPDVTIPGPDELHIGELYLHPFPASMDTDMLPAAVRRMRPPLPAPTGAAPGDVLDGFGADRPAVYVTFGTEFGPLAPWQAVLDAVASTDVDALLTTGAAGLPQGVTVPRSVRVASYVDQGEVLDRCAAVVSHGGSGTVLGAAAAGVPQVCIPIGADQFENAAAVAARGLGVSVGPHGRDPASIAEAIRTALSNPALASAAREVAAEIHGMPTAATAATWIEELASA